MKTCLGSRASRPFRSPCNSRGQRKDRPLLLQRMEAPEAIYNRRPRQTYPHQPFRLGRICNPRTPQSRIHATIQGRPCQVQNWRIHWDIFHSLVHIGSIADFVSYGKEEQGLLWNSFCNDFPPSPTFIVGKGQGRGLRSNYNPGRIRRRTCGRRSRICGVWLKDF